MNVVYDDSMEILKEAMQAVADGDRAAFSRLYDLTNHRLMGVALHILRRRDWAEELGVEPKGASVSAPPPDLKSGHPTGDDTLPCWLPTAPLLGIRTRPCPARPRGER